MADITAQQKQGSIAQINRSNTATVQRQVVQHNLKSEPIFPKTTPIPLILVQEIPFWLPVLHLPVWHPMPEIRQWVKLVPLFLQ